MVHAIEAYTSKHKKNLVSDVLAREALALLSSNIRSHFVTIAWKRTLYTLSTYKIKFTTTTTTKATVSQQAEM